jgi:hypothetical protein
MGHRAFVFVTAVSTLLALGCDPVVDPEDEPATEAATPVDVNDALTDPDRGTVISYPTVQPEGSNIRCVDRSWPRQYLERHAAQSVVMSTLSSPTRSRFPSA